MPVNCNVCVAHTGLLADAEITGAWLALIETVVEDEAVHPPALNVT